jgi:hypothetical protein
MTDREVNIPLLRKAVEWAEAEAAKPAIDSQWVQGLWVSNPSDVAEELIEDTPLDEWSGTQYRQAVAAIAPEHCGTAYCIAGNVGQSLDARYATTDVVENVHVAHFAANALGIEARRQPAFRRGQHHRGRSPHRRGHRG